MSAINRSVISTFAAALVAASVLAPSLAQAGAVSALVAGFAGGWARLARTPSVRGSAVVIAGSGLLAVAATAVGGGMRELALISAFGIVASFLHQMWRTGARNHLIESLIMTAAGSVLAVCGAGWLLAMRSPLGDAVTILLTCSFAAAALVTALPLPPSTVALAASAAGTILSAVLGLVFHRVGLVPGVTLGFVAGVLMAGCYILWNKFPVGLKFDAALAAALAPILALGVPAFQVASLLP